MIPTSELEIRNMIGGRLFSRLRPEFYEFRPYSAERLYEIIEHRIKQVYGKLMISKEALPRSAISLPRNARATLDTYSNCF